MKNNALHDITFYYGAISQILTYTRNGLRMNCMFIRQMPNYYKSANYFHIIAISFITHLAIFYYRSRIGYSSAGVAV